MSRSRPRNLRWIEEFADAEFYPLVISISAMETTISKIENEDQKLASLEHGN